MEFAAYDKEFVGDLIKAGIEINSVYDVGASSGWWSWAIAQIVPQASFQLFEPLATDQHSPDLAKVLQLCPGFRLHRMALGAENATLEIKIPELAIASTLVNWHAHHRIKSRERVSVRRLDDVVVDFGLPQADVIKIDTGL